MDMARQHNFDKDLEHGTGVTYPRGAKLFHWLLAAIIILSWCIGFYAAHLQGNAPRGGTVLEIHKAIASTVIFLAVGRILYRWSNRRRYPPLLPNTGRLAAIAAHTTHGLLYCVAMVAAPLTGWYWSSVAGFPVPFLGLFDLPAIAPANQGLYDFAMWSHRSMVWIAGALIALHILAAIKHAIIDRDGIFRRIL